MPRFSRSRVNFRFRPTLESLEGRDCPSAYFHHHHDDAPPAITPAVAPTLSLLATVQDTQTVVLSGVVSDANPGGLTVTFSGAYSGSAETYPDGSYAVSATVNASGAVQATVTDAAGLTSDPVSASFTLPAETTPPTLSFQALPQDSQTVMLIGDVSDQAPGGLTVTFTGVYTGSTVTNADGSYLLMATVSASGTINASVTNAAGLSSGVTASTFLLPDAPPTGTSDTATPPSLTLAATVQDSQTVVLSGVVSDPSPGGLTVTFTGAYTGSVVTNSDGSYSLTATVSAAGTVQATVTNAAGLTSGAASATFALPPSITLAVTPLDQRWVLLSGQVTDANPGGLTVQFTGEYTGSVVTNADGSYSVTVEAVALGDIQATVTDSAGLTSNVAVATVISQDPTILDFQAVHQAGNLYTFSGTVEDETPTGLGVVLGGITALQGQTVAVGADGSFSLTVTVAAGDSGMATALVTDWWGLTSPTAQVLVDAT